MLLTIVYASGAASATSLTAKDMANELTSRVVLSPSKLRGRSVAAMTLSLLNVMPNRRTHSNFSIGSVIKVIFSINKEKRATIIEIAQKLFAVQNDASVSLTLLMLNKLFYDSSERVMQKIANQIQSHPKEKVTFVDIAAMLQEKGAA